MEEGGRGPGTHIGKTLDLALLEGELFPRLGRFRVVVQEEQQRPVRELRSSLGSSEFEGVDGRE